MHETGSVTLKTNAQARNVSPELEVAEPYEPILVHDEVVSEFGEVQIAVAFPEEKTSPLDSESLPAPARNPAMRSRYVTAENRCVVWDLDPGGGGIFIDEQTGEALPF